MTLFQGLAGQIEAVIGREATVTLLRERGGCTIAVPVAAGGTMLERLIGLEAAERFIAAFGAGRMTLPCSDARGRRRRRAEAKRLLAEGLSLQEVALRCDLHTRTVSNYRAEMQAANDQAQLKLPL
jgi:hypothetical protein